MEPNREAYAKGLRRMRQRFAEKRCMAPFPDHAGPIISAHTLSAEAMLRPVARAGHVYTWHTDQYPKGDEPPVNEKLKGIRETSVFNGFCSKHDKALFSCLEDQPFVCAPEQLFALAYRAVAKEAYLKRRQFESFPTPQDIAEARGLPNPSHYMYEPDMQLYHDSVRRGSEDMERIKVRYDQLLIDQEYRRLISTVIPFNGSAKIVCNSIFAPDMDFEGRPLQDFANLSRDIHTVTISVLPSAGGGFAVLSYLDVQEDGPKQLIDSLTSQGDLTSSLVWLIMCYSENIAISPEWWEGLHEEVREEMRRVFRSTINAFDSWYENLRENRLRLASWDFAAPFVI